MVFEFHLTRQVPKRLSRGIAGLLELNHHHFSLRIATLHCDAPRVAARSPVSGASCRRGPHPGATRPPSPLGQCGSAACHMNESRFPPFDPVNDARERMARSSHRRAQPVVAPASMRGASLPGHGAGRVRMRNAHPVPSGRSPSSGFAQRSAAHTLGCSAAVSTSYCS